MNQRVEMEIGGATVVVTSETIKQWIVKRSLLRRRESIQDGIVKELQIDNADTHAINDIFVNTVNFCVFSARLKVKQGEMPFKMLLPSDTDKVSIKKALQFLDIPKEGEYEELIDLINRIDNPDEDIFAPGATDQYKDLEAHEFDELPEEEKKS